MAINWERFVAVFHQPLSRNAKIGIAGFFLGMVGFVWFFNHYKLSVNLSESLPGKLYLVERGALPAKGEYAEFRFEGETYYIKGSHFLKRVAGVGGAVVNAVPLPDGRTEFFVDGASVGIAKLRARDGRALEASKSRIIEPGYYYMAATNPDSFDSRYELFGKVGADQIVGRAIELF